MHSESALPSRTTQLTKTFLITLLPMLLVIAGISLAIYKIEAERSALIIKGREISFLKQYQNSIANELMMVSSDLMIVSEFQDLQKLLDGYPLNRNNLENAYLIFNKNRGIYDQIRFLDNTGMEIVRINYNNGSPAAVPESALQFKGDRYYFRDTYNLERGEIFISPFDLNMEKGKIERPLKPMIRIGTPVFDSSGIKKGIVILNYLGSRLLQQIDIIAANNSGKLMLLNSNGYWLKHPVSKKEWGFMYEHKKNTTFGNEYPAVWDQIESSNSDQILNSAGLFSYTTIHTLSRMQHNSAINDAFTAPEAAHRYNEYNWKIVSFVPQSILRAGNFKLLNSIIAIDGILFLLLSASSMLYSQSSVDRKQAETELRDSEGKFRAISTSAQDAILMMDNNGKISFWNDAAIRIFGWRREDALEKNLHDLIVPQKYHAAHNIGLKNFHLTGEGAAIGKTLDLDGKRRDGTEFPVELSLAGVRVKGQWHAIGIMRDITQRKEMEEQLKAAAITDALTGLFNRRGFFTLAEQHCKLAKRNHKKMSLMYIDLNRFKEINDRLGHKAGDQVLKDTAEILRSSFRESDILTRLGGDEFAVLLTDTTGPPCEKTTLNQMHEKLIKYNTEGSHDYSLSFSTGIAHYNPDHPRSIEELLTSADALMYEDKKHYTK